MSSTPPPATEKLLARIAHELRAPLNGIGTWAHVLETQLGENADATVRRAIAGIRTGVQQQVRLIDELVATKQPTEDSTPDS